MASLLMRIVIRVTVIRVNGDFKVHWYLIMDGFTVSRWMRERHRGGQRDRTLSEQPMIHV